MYGIRRVQPAASERARRYGDMPGKQKRLTGQHVFFKEKCVFEKSVGEFQRLFVPSIYLAENDTLTHAE